MIAFFREHLETTLGIPVHFGQITELTTLPCAIVRTTTAEHKQSFSRATGFRVSAIAVSIFSRSYLSVDSLFEQFAAAYNGQWIQLGNFPTRCNIDDEEDEAYPAPDGSDDAIYARETVVRCHWSATPGAINNPSVNYPGYVPLDGQEGEVLQWLGGQSSWRLLPPYTWWVPPRVSGRAYDAPGLDSLVSGVIGNRVMVTGQIEVMPFVPQVDLQFASVGVVVNTAAAGSNVVVCIYSDSAGPGALLWTAGLDTSAAGYRSLAVTGTLSAGQVYWIGQLVTGTPTLKNRGLNQLYVLGAPSNTTPSGYLGYRRSGISAPPDPFSPVESELVTTPAPVLVRLVAA
jgi:hypothetical protein